MSVAEPTAGAAGLTPPAGPEDQAALCLSFQETELPGVGNASEAPFQVPALGGKGHGLGLSGSW